jgi:hypothetical protein
LLPDLKFKLIFLDIIVKFRFYKLSDKLKWLPQMTVLILHHHYTTTFPTQTTITQEIPFVSSCSSAATICSHSSAGQASTTPVKRKLSDMQETISTHFDVVQTNLKSALYDFSKSKKPEGSRTVEKCIRLNKAIENKLDFMIKKTKQDMSALILFAKNRKVSAQIS